MDQSDAGSAGMFSQWTNQTQEAWVYSHDGPIGRTGVAVHGAVARLRPDDKHVLRGALVGAVTPPHVRLLHMHEAFHV
eukprot:2476102-Pyramimonas_sp.AAC.1